MTRRRKRLGVIGGGWRRKPRDVEPGRFEPGTRHFRPAKRLEFSMRPASEDRMKMNGIRVGEWADLGEYTPDRSKRVREILKGAKSIGKLPKCMRILRNCDNRLIVIYPPEKA